MKNPKIEKKVSNFLGKIQVNTEVSLELVKSKKINKLKIFSMT